MYHFKYVHKLDYQMNGLLVKKKSKVNAKKRKKKLNS